MQALTSYLTDIFSNAFKKSGFDTSYGDVVICGQPELGQFQCNGALPAAKALGQNPRDIAQKVIDALGKDREIFGDINVAGPGFINLSLKDDFLSGYLQQMADDERLGVAKVLNPRRVVVDYGGANVAKPMHVGHLRPGIIGESIKRLFQFMGDDVIGDVHLGDWGLQMGMIIAELEKRNPSWPYFDSGYTGAYPQESPVTLADLEDIYPAASARAKDDPAAMDAARQATVELQNGNPGYTALWRHFVNISIAGLKSDYGALNVHFDLWLGESDVQCRIPSLIERLEKEGFATESEGALVIDVSEPGDKKPTPPLILRKSDGAVLYATTDLATIEQRVEEFKAQLILYVVDHRQRQHFEQVFRAAYKCGVAPASLGLEHNYNGTMNGPDGKPFKTRSGGIMKLHDLIQELYEAAQKRMSESNVASDYPQEERQEIARMVGIAALKYADLMNQRTKDFSFDIERFSAFDGRTGPYLLYTTVRARSIMAKAAAQGLQPGKLIAASVAAERDLMLQLMLLPNSLDMAYKTRMPNHLADYVYNICNNFNRFYNSCHILRAEDKDQQASWLEVTRVFEKASTQVLTLLGIEIPQRM